MVRAIFFDIDGTLISAKTMKCPESTKMALEKLRKKGIHLFVATGRHVLEIQEENLIDGLYFDAYITLNGQYCFNEKELIHDNAIHQNDIKNIINQMDKHPYPCMFLEKDRMYINMVNEEVIEAQQTIHTAIPPVMDIKRALENPIYQVVAYVDPVKAKNFPLSVLNYSRSTRWHPLAIDIVPQSGSKRDGIQRVLEYYQIPLEETMAFGDGLNDLEMLEYVEIGVAMGNAAEKVKKAADYITDDVDHDGILRALEHFQILS